VIAIEKEYEMALQDRVMEETKDKKNAVESYVYAMRDKVSSKQIIVTLFLIIFYAVIMQINSKNVFL
jgi:hypothetical protein